MFISPNFVLLWKGTDTILLPQMSNENFYFFLFPSLRIYYEPPTVWERESAFCATESQTVGGTYNAQNEKGTKKIAETLCEEIRYFEKINI